MNRGKLLRKLFPAALLLGGLFVGSALAQAPRVPTQVDGGQRAAASVRGDLRFEPNVGQAASDGEFVARGRDYVVSLRRGEARLALERGKSVQLKLVGADSPVRGQALEQLASKSHYFQGRDRSTWRPHVPHFARVRYANVYPGVDLEYHGNGQQLEFTFVLSPGADPGRIAMAVGGAKRVSLDGDGQLVLEMPGGTLRILRPLVYQQAAGHRRKIDARYVLKRGNRFGFHLADFDSSLPLVIDPVLSYSTYLGGSGNDEGFAVAADNAGNTYVTGRTGSANFPTTGGVAQSSKSSLDDVFVSKFDASGALVYSTYLGGSGNDIGRGIAVSAAGRAYITGETNSLDFPVTPGALQTSNGSPFFPFDAFVVRLSADGSALDYSTYLGGNGNDQAFGLALDSFENAYVTGQTQSPTFPVVAAFQSSLSGSRDAFVSKLNSSGNGLIYSTYFGGSKIEHAWAIAVDSTGAAYVVGPTTSNDLPTLSAMQASPAGGDDAFVAKFAASGMPIYATYLGGSFGEQGFSVAVDALGSAYVTGVTESTNFPVLNALQAAHAGGNNDIFVTKFDPAGSSLAYSTYLGGSGSDAGRSIAVDGFGQAYLTGLANSIDFPILNAIPGISVGPAFLTQIDAAGTALVASTRLGPGFGFGIAVDESETVHLTGRTSSSSFPTMNPAQATLAGGDDAFVLRVTSSAPPPVLDTTPPVLTVPATFLVEATSVSGGAANYLVTAIDAVDGAIAAECTPPSGSSFPFGVTAVTCTATDTAGNTATGSFDVIVQDTAPPVLVLPAAIDVEPMNMSGAVVNYTATASDTVNGAIAPACTLPSGYTFPVGITRVNCSASDARGNTAAGFFDVWVRLEPISVSSAEVAGDAWSEISPDRSIASFDARYVAFESAAANLVAGDTNGLPDIFVRDRFAGNTVRISVSSAGAEANGISRNPSMSLDGRFVAFLSFATNLEASIPLPSGIGDFFLHDRDADRNRIFDEPGGISTIRVSRGNFGIANFSIAHRDNHAPSLSGDGRFVAFSSDPRNYPALVPAVGHGLGDFGQPFIYEQVYLYDAATGDTELVSRPHASITTSGHVALGGSVNPSMSADGRFIAFQADALNLADTGIPGFAQHEQVAGWQIYLWDRLMQNISWVSKSSPVRLADLLPDEGEGCGGWTFIDPSGEVVCFLLGWHINPSISGDGSTIAFISKQRNLVSNDTNGIQDVFVYSGGQLERANLSTSGAEAVHDPACGTLHDSGSLFMLEEPENNPTMSFDGRLVAFFSCSGNLDPADSNSRADIFVRDRLTGTTRLITTNSNAAPINERSDGARISPDGATILFINPSPALMSPISRARHIYAKATGIALSLSGPDDDADGVLDVIEDGAPNNGDGNNDGIADRDQADVTSLPNTADGQYVTVAAPTGTTLVDVTSSATPPAAGAPAGATFPVGYLAFSVAGLPAGAAAIVTIHLPAAISVNSYYKYGKTPENPTAHWYNFSYDGTTGAEIFGNQIVLHFVDGQRGDDDLTANGVVTDPGAPALADLTPPTTTTTLSGTAGNNGWYRSAVNVTLTCADNDSGSGCASTEYRIDGGAFASYITTFEISDDGTHVVEYRSMDAAGNMEATKSQSLQIDGTPPRVTASASPAANANGWNNSDVTVTASGIDDTSGIDTCESSTVDTEGAGQSRSVGCTDKAGNSASASVGGINIDLTRPTIAGSPDRAPNANNWYNATVTVSFTCADALSGVDSCAPTPQLVSEEGAELSRSATVVDKAGNIAEVTVGGINLDKTPPVVTCSNSAPTLWPPNHKLEPVQAAVIVTDALSSPAGFTLLSATSNEPDNGLGDGDTANDIQGFTIGSPDTSGQLRAERSGRGTGRIYSLGYQGADLAGNVMACTTLVTVPHNQGNGKK